MIRRLRLAPTAGALGAGRTGAVRLLAVSDERDPALDDARNRVALGRIDAVVGCGDLEPDYLCFLADSFRAPLFYIRGNHDRGAAWAAGENTLPGTLDDRIESVSGVRLLGFSWPGPAEGPPRREESGAWTQALGAIWRTGFGRRAPQVVLSHVPPSGLGDVPADPFHRGFGAYRWLCRALRPRLWLHGHTTSAAAEDWRTTHGPTTLVNVTGAVLIELGAAVTAELPADSEPHTETDPTSRSPAPTPPARARPARAEPAGTTWRMP